VSDRILSLFFRDVKDGGVAGERGRKSSRDLGFWEKGRYTPPRAAKEESRKVDRGPIHQEVGWGLAEGFSEFLTRKRKPKDGSLGYLGKRGIVVAKGSRIEEMRELNWLMGQDLATGKE